VRICPVPDQEILFKIARFKLAPWNAIVTMDQFRELVELLDQVGASWLGASCSRERPRSHVIVMLVPPF
jgi:hypothetical protein